MAAWGVLYSGSAAISTTEYSLTLSSTSGAPAAKTEKVTAQLFLDLANMVAGDQYELKLYDKCRAGDTQRLIERWVFTGAQQGTLTPLPSLMLGEGWDFTVKRLAGSDRTIGWSIRGYS